MKLVDTNRRCHECAHYERTPVFELCRHSASSYTIAEKTDFHTIGHMRTVGACRDAAVMFAPIPERRSVTRKKAA